MKWISAISTFVMLLAFGLSVESQDSSEKTSLSWTGCGITKKAFMAEAAAAYEKESGVKIKLSGGGAAKGLKFASMGVARMGGSCRHCLPKAVKEEDSVQLTVVAWDALVPIVHKDNPVSDLSVSQLKAAFTGKVQNWKEFGGPDEPIKVIVRSGKLSGVGHMLRVLLFNDPDLAFHKGAVRVRSSGPLEKKVELEKGALGVTGISSAKRRSVKILKLGGKAPTRANIASGEYSTYRPLYIATSGSPDAETKKFLAWLTGEKGQKVVDSCGTVTLAEAKGLKAKYGYWGETSKITNFDALP